MSETTGQNQPTERRDQNSWAKPMSRLKVSQVPEGATNINMDGLQVTSPLQGFGQMWQKTFRVRLTGCSMTPSEVMELWKANFVKFQPAFNHFYASSNGVLPGDVMFIDSTVPVMPGTPGVLPVTTGVMILYADENMFTVMTPEGHPESGWNTFSVYEEDGAIVAQVQGMTRSTDPIYEFGFRFMGGSQMQDKTWTHMLKSLSRACGVETEVQVTKVCIDPRIQWSQTRNVWKNAVVRTTFYKLGTPIRWVRRQFGSRI